MVYAAFENNSLPFGLYIFYTKLKIVGKVKSSFRISLNSGWKVYQK